MPFYAKANDEHRCHGAQTDGAPILVTGLDSAGAIRAFYGVVQSVEVGHAQFAGYPLRITMLVAAN